METKEYLNGGHFGIRCIVEVNCDDRFRSCCLSQLTVEMSASGSLSGG